MNMHYLHVLYVHVYLLGVKNGFPTASEVLGVDVQEVLPVDDDGTG